MKIDKNMSPAEKYVQEFRELVLVMCVEKGMPRNIAVEIWEALEKYYRFKIENSN